MKSMTCPARWRRIAVVIPLLLMRFCTFLSCALIIIMIVKTTLVELVGEPKFTRNEAYAVWTSLALAALLETKIADTMDCSRIVDRIRHSRTVRASGQGPWYWLGLKLQRAGIEACMLHCELTEHGVTTPWNHSWTVQVVRIGATWQHCEVHIGAPGIFGMLNDSVIEISHAVPTDSYTWEVKANAAMLELKCISLASLSAFLAACQSDLTEPLINVRPSSVDLQVSGLA